MKEDIWANAPEDATMWYAGWYYRAPNEEPGVMCQWWANKWRRSGWTVQEAIALMEKRPFGGSTLAPDMVNEPPHYKQGAIECIDTIEPALTPEEFRGFLKGNALKYVYRERLKGGAESLKKARWYLDKLIGDNRG